MSSGSGVDVPSYLVASCAFLTSCAHVSSPSPLWRLIGVAPEPIPPVFELGPTFSLGLPFAHFLGQSDGTVAGILPALFLNASVNFCSLPRHRSSGDCDYAERPPSSIWRAFYNVT